MIMAVVGKVAGGYAGARLAGLGAPMIVGRILVPRGEFSLVLAKAVDEAAVAPAVTIYPIAGFAVLATALIAPFLGKVKVSIKPSSSSSQTARVCNYHHATQAHGLGNFDRL